MLTKSIAAILIVTVANCVESRSVKDANATEEDFLAACLNAHNSYRKTHGSPPLELDPEIVDYSKKRALELAQQDSLSVKGGKYGENLFYSWSPQQNVKTYDCERVVESWYDTGKNYNYDDPNDSANFNKAGTFTQVIWAATSKLGCGQAANSNGKIFTVCNYYVPGNLSRKFGDNIGRPRPTDQ